MRQTDVTLSPAKQRTIDALMDCPNASAAAVKAGISRATLYRWLSEPAFVAALRAAQARAVDQAARRLAVASANAVDQLIALSKTADKDSVKLGACNSILSHSLPYHELTAIADEVADLRRQIEGLKNATP
jgi:phage terminase small subunit